MDIAYVKKTRAKMYRETTALYAMLLPRPMAGMVVTEAATTTTELTG